MRVVLERPLKAEACMCGWMWVVRRAEISVWRDSIRDVERGRRDGGEDRRLSL